MALPYPKLSEPIIRTPFTDMGAAMITQQRSICKSFELKFMQCMEAYGKSIGDVKCKDYFDDLQECTLLSKQVICYHLLLKLKFGF